MKKISLKPGFEIIFSLSLVAVLGLPLLVLGQTQKNIRIEIVNGDTTINGKNIKKLSAAERKDALAEMDNMGNLTIVQEGANGRDRIVVRKRNEGGKQQDVLIERDREFGEDMAFGKGRMLKDTSNKIVKLRKLRRLNSADSTFAFDFKMNDEAPLRLKLDRDFRMNGPGVRPMRMRFNNRNVQNFDFENSDRNGIVTHMHFTVTDETLNDKTKPLKDFDKSYLSIRDLIISPEFSTGKINLSFSLPNKAIGEVTLWDYDVIIWKEKITDGVFNKKVSWPMNGTYTLTVKQGANAVTKRILKQN